MNRVLPLWVNIAVIRRILLERVSWQCSRSSCSSSLNIRAHRPLWNIVEFKRHNWIKNVSDVKTIHVYANETEFCGNTRGPSACNRLACIMYMYVLVCTYTYTCRHGLENSPIKM